MSFEIDEQFAVEGVAACYGTGDQARVVADEPFPLFEGNSLILDALLRQSLIVSLPIQPLCKFGWDLPCPNDTAPINWEATFRGAPSSRSSRTSSSLRRTSGIENRARCHGGDHAPSKSCAER